MRHLFQTPRGDARARGANCRLHLWSSEPPFTLRLHFQSSTTCGLAVLVPRREEKPLSPIHVFTLYWLPLKRFQRFLSPSCQSCIGTRAATFFVHLVISAEATPGVWQLRTPGMAGGPPEHLVPAPSTRLPFWLWKSRSTAVSMNIALLLSCIHKSNLEGGARGLS